MRNPPGTLEERHRPATRSPAQPSLRVTLLWQSCYCGRWYRHPDTVGLRNNLRWSLAMHIPDGYLSPATCAALYAGSAPFWYTSLQKMKRALNTRMVPLLAVFA